MGATRFVGQKAGNEEMATDQFGSGGGFSKMFGQSPDAKWQSDDVANYLKVLTCVHTTQTSKLLRAAGCPKGSSIPS